ncbi:hypothetical protein CYMTET_38999 [Cymbomonas tetramitiformis]|uniref:Uncharacterized protein n=1 Tax=Cymbomonas tetramitiformis TaxID=36881 RepID=A0AAE0F611_9CHLO|nr:hypothetical protein CYMTET_39004 [Cymbomonas tetramitiformis]KAK3251670.1 hypothetical protein CYMTET_38999 [Cymbomonas tetramitiformis]
MAPSEDEFVFWPVIAFRGSEDSGLRFSSRAFTILNPGSADVLQNVVHASKRCTIGKLDIDECDRGMHMQLKKGSMPDEIPCNRLFDVAWRQTSKDEPLYVITGDLHLSGP